MPLVKDDTPYTDAAPDLFGSDFLQTVKKLPGAGQNIRSSLPSRSGQYSGDNRGKPIFRKGQSSGSTSEAEPSNHSSTGVTDVDRLEKTNNDYVIVVNNYIIVVKNV